MQGIALPRDLVGIREALRLAPKVAERLGDWRVEAEDFRAADFPLCGDVLTLLESALVDDPPANLSTPGLIRPGFDAELDSLVERSRHANGSPAWSRSSVSGWASKISRSATTRSSATTSK